MIADGSLFIEKEPPHYVTLAFYQNDLETLDIVRQIFESPQSSQDNRNQIPNHCLRYRGRKVFEIVHTLLPYMWECPKKRDAQLLLENKHLWFLPMRQVTSSIMVARLKVANSMNILATAGKTSSEA